MPATTIAAVKRDLPDVLATWNGKTWRARVSGRLNEFATVSPYLDAKPGRQRVATIIGPCFQFAWSTVARAVDTGRPLICD